MGRYFSTQGSASFCSKSPRVIVVLLFMRTMQDNSNSPSTSIVLKFQNNNCYYLLSNQDWFLERFIPAIIYIYIYVSNKHSIPILSLLLNKTFLRLVQQHLNHLHVLQNIRVRRLSNQRIQREVQILHRTPLFSPHIIIHVELFHFRLTEFASELPPKRRNHFLVHFALHSF